MLYFLIPAVVAVLLIVLLIFKDGQFRNIIKWKSTKDEKLEDMYSKIEKLKKDEIDFLYESTRQSLNETYALRDGENKTILSHTAIFVSAVAFFYFICKWTYHNYGDCVGFIILSSLLVVALIFLVISIAAIFAAFQVTYRLPPEAKNVIEQSLTNDVNNLKMMLVDKWVQSAAMNYSSNVRKMNLLTTARRYLIYALATLLVAFLVIVCNQYFDIAMIIAKK